MYRNIAFDLGGVVVDFAPHDFLLENFCSAPIEQKVYDITFGSKEWQQLDAGLITVLRATPSCWKRAASRAARLRCRRCWIPGCAACAPATARWI